MNTLLEENYLNYPSAVKEAMGINVDTPNVKPVPPVPPTPVGPADNEIWYWGEFYDLENAISVLEQQATYKGPAVVSNKQVGDKYVITFYGAVTKLGANVEPMEVYPIFMNNPERGIECHITGVKIPNSVTTIGYAAFSNCTGLTSVTIPNSVTDIGGSSFYNCTGLTSVTIGNSVTSIGNDAFSCCSGLTSIHISDIAAWCAISFGTDNANPLYYAHNLYLNGELVTDLVIPNSVTGIGEYAFYDCTSLTSVTIPNSVASIEGCAFEECSSLASVTIPNSVTNIEYSAFFGCSGLTSITIPDSVTNIGDYAFNECSGLTSVTCKATTPPTLGSDDVFDNTNDCPIYVPVESVDTYKAAEHWSDYTDRIQAIQ